MDANTTPRTVMISMLAPLMVVELQITPQIPTTALMPLWSVTITMLAPMIPAILALVASTNPSFVTTTMSALMTLATLLALKLVAHSHRTPTVMCASTMEFPDITAQLLICATPFSVT
jgi:hypothetical protein